MHKKLRAYSHGLVAEAAGSGSEFARDTGRPQTVLWIFSLHGLRTLAVRVLCLVNRQSVFSPEASAVTSLLGVRQMPKSGE
jgi:hypothetical protein